MQLNQLKLYFNSFIDLLYPNICAGCEDSLSGNEDTFCTICLSKLPLTHFWNQKENPVEQLFWGRIAIEHATSFIYFEKDSRFQHALHQLKYKGNKWVGIQLGKLYGNYLLNSRFASVDVIVPVPLHKKRLQKRGYNQSELIAKGLAKSMNKPMLSQAVTREIYTTSQTKKGRYSRWLNVEGIFKCQKPELLTNKHILIIDDVVTTGATIESLAQELSKIKNVTLSVATIAVAS